MGFYSEGPVCSARFPGAASGTARFEQVGASAHSIVSQIGAAFAPVFPCHIFQYDIFTDYTWEFYPLANDELLADELRTCEVSKG